MLQAQWLEISLSAMWSSTSLRLPAKHSFSADCEENIKKGNPVASGRVAGVRGQDRVDEVAPAPG
jgi:hypothetical protein